MTDCDAANLGVLVAWNYPQTLPSDFSTNCCNLASFSSIITCQGNNIISLNLSSTGISGQTPISILKLTALQTLDISYNPKIVGDFKSISALPSLKTFIASGDSGVTGSVVSFPSTVTDCRFDGTGLCGNPGTCQTKVTPLAACANSTTGGGQPYDLIPLTPGIPLYICLGAFALMLSIFSLMCCFCSQRGRVARLEQSGEATRANKKLVQRDYAEPSDTEMSMITLSRNGPPPRSYSLPESREGLSKEAAELDVKAREPFLEANTPPGADEFPVRRPYQKSRPDELNISRGDMVVLLRVFRDGWAEGVSRRNGGPAIFPLACLDGGVPIVLAERLRVARSVMAAGPARPPAFVPAPPPGVPAPPPGSVLAPASYGPPQPIRQNSGHHRQ